MSYWWDTYGGRLVLPKIADRSIEVVKKRNDPRFVELPTLVKKFKETHKEKLRGSRKMIIRENGRPISGDQIFRLQQAYKASLPYTTPFIKDRLKSRAAAPATVVVPQARVRSPPPKLRNKRARHDDEEEEEDVDDIMTRALRANYGIGLPKNNADLGVDIVRATLESDDDFQRSEKTRVNVLEFMRSYGFIK